MTCGSPRGAKLSEESTIENGPFTAGQVVALIHNIPTLKELADRIVKEAEEEALPAEGKRRVETAVQARGTGGGIN